MTTQRASQSSRDLLAGVPLRRATSPASAPNQPPELAAARALCRQIRRKQARAEKQRIAHLICLNLVSMLKRGSPR
jgi:hypothetical protein